MNTVCSRPAGLSLSSIASTLRDCPQAENNRDFLSGLRKAAVLLPLLCDGDQWHLLFIRRTELVQDHKGQVSFPGGAFEPEDADLEDTALRETWEEVGIPSQEINLLGKLPVFSSVSGFAITPVVGQIPWSYPLKLEPEEVSRAFTIPIEWLANSANWSEKPYTRLNRRQEKVIFFNPYDGELLWGITARITLDFLKLLRLGQSPD
jgi:8-oxo-dGTP pyrophosphatase MutT (NUDIX family)